MKLRHHFLFGWVALAAISFLFVAAEKLDREAAARKALRQHDTTAVIRTFSAGEIVDLATTSNPVKTESDRVTWKDWEGREHSRLGTVTVDHMTPAEAEGLYDEFHGTGIGDDAD